MILLNNMSGTRSSLVRSIWLLRTAVALVAVFLSLRLILAATDLKDVRFGSLLKLLNMGVAAASYWLIGGSPKINSIVRSIEEVEYIVLSTKPRFTKPPAT